MKKAILGALVLAVASYSTAQEVPRRNDWSKVMRVRPGESLVVEAVGFPSRELIVAKITGEDLRFVEPEGLKEAKLSKTEAVHLCGREERHSYFGRAREIDPSKVCGRLARDQLLEVRAIGGTAAKRGALTGGAVGFLLGLACLEAGAGGECLAGNTIFFSGLGGLIGLTMPGRDKLIYEAVPPGDEPSIREWRGPSSTALKERLIIRSARPSPGLPRPLSTPGLATPPTPPR
jgi:hypothetical protein